MFSRSENRPLENLPAAPSAENAASSPEATRPESIGAKSARPDSPGTKFTTSERRILLGIARASVASGIAGEPLPDSPPSPSSSPASLSPSFLQSLAEPRGVFTTIYLDRQLRGCVGYALPVCPLYRAIAETARAAAFEDTRFWPVTPEEAANLQFSLSVLSPLFAIAPAEVEVGRHGLLISDGKRRGLLLPQVPVEHAWDRDTFLAQTCHKAGLPLDAWQKSATIEAFTAQVLDEFSDKVDDQSAADSADESL
jgi:AmmeMemoRadiSam system protein A